MEHMLCFGAGLESREGGGGNVLETPQREKACRVETCMECLTSVISVAEEEKEKEVQPMMVQFDRRHHQHHHHQSVRIMYLCNVAAHHLSLSLSISNKQNYTNKPTYLPPTADA